MWHMQCVFANWKKKQYHKCETYTLMYRVSKGNQPESELEESTSLFIESHFYFCAIFLVHSLSNPHAVKPSPPLNLPILLHLVFTL